ncbi:MAG: ABC transporter substrate-binding protein [Lachnospiraceae bacterium]|nr:ABC transporter substrate-binding protein [Lachnospiraceae bacterium]
MKRMIYLGLLCAMLCFAGGCDKKEQQSESIQEITMVLDWTPNTNHTGLYVAQEKGYFEEAGLKVSIVQPPSDGAVDMVASEGAQFGIGFQDTLAAAFGTDVPLPVTAVGAVLQHNTSGLVSLKEKGIDSPGKLEGYNYATWDSPVEQAVLKNVVEEDGGDFGKVSLISIYVEDIVAALNADIDSVWIYQGWDGIKLQLEQIDTNYLPFADMNPVFDYYSPVIIANNTFLEENQETAKAFMEAVKKGYEYAADHPEESAEILLQAAPELDEALVKASQEYLSTQYMADADAWGIIDPGRWNAYYNWINEKQLTEREIPENTGFSNQYLPE